MMAASPVEPTVVPLRADGLGGIAQANVAVPAYDRKSLSGGIVHFGVGGFHRAHEAMYLDTLMREGLAHDWAVCGVGLMPGDRRTEEVMHAQDCLYTLIIKAPDGSRSARVIGSIVEYLFAPDDPGKVLKRLTAPAIRIVSLTVTEAGYNVHRVTGEFDPDGPGIAEDLAQPHAPQTVFGFIVEALARRRAAGTAPFTVVSCDNVQGNGHVTRDAILGFARLRDAELADWIDEHVAFPNSMVDRITPATTDDDRRLVREEFGVGDEWPVVCEPFAQWVLEDSFTDGRPPFERAGVQIVDDVEPYELMKLRLLNASHQALGYAGYLAGYRYAHEAMADPAFAELLRRYMYDEAIPSLRPVPGVDLNQYVEQLIERFGNPVIRDTLARLCVDSSERMPKFVLPVLHYQLEHGGPIDRATAVVASWARYAEGVDEQGEPIDIVDPLADVLTAAALRQREQPLAFVENRHVFGDLVDDARFVASYTRALSGLLNQGGVRAVIDGLAVEGPETQRSVVTTAPTSGNRRAHA
jgi:mannitol 2-dehydrogenase